MLNVERTSREIIIMKTNWLSLYYKRFNFTSDNTHAWINRAQRLIDNHASFREITVFTIQNIAYKLIAVCPTIRATRMLSVALSRAF